MLSMMMATGAKAQEMLVRLADNRLVRYDVSQVQYVTFWETAFVDLELPSGTLWATCNLGAVMPEEFGDYFAWGETEPKYIYDKSTYKWWEYFQGSNENGDYYKYTYDVKATRTAGDFVGGDGLRELEPADDAATANWGSSWQMPSRDQCRELKNNCACQYNTIRNGVHGTLVTGPNGNSIFLPAAGTRHYKYYYDEG